MIKVKVCCMTELEHPTAVYVCGRCEQRPEICGQLESYVQENRMRVLVTRTDGCRGATLLKSLCKADLNLAELVDLVACVKPEIRQYYDSREKREEQKLIVPAYPHSGI